MKRLAIDIELNQPDRQIWEIGWAVGDKEVEAKGSIFIESSELSPYIEDLCKTSNRAEKEEYRRYTPIPRENVGAALKALRNRYNPEGTVLTWGSGDLWQIKQQFPDAWAFGSRYTDVKTMALEHKGFFGGKKKGGLRPTMEAFGLEFEGTEHWACDDAANTLRMFFELRKRARSVWVLREFLGDSASLREDFTILGVYGSKAAAKKALHDYPKHTLTGVMSEDGLSFNYYVDWDLSLVYDVVEMPIEEM